MNDKEVYILGNYKPGDADGLAEFNFQNVSLLKNEFHFHFVQFDKSKDSNFYKHELKDSIDIHIFGNKSISRLKLPDSLRKWIKTLNHKKVIFHLSHIYNLTNYLVAKELLKCNIPYLITPHDSYVYSPSYTKGKPFIKKLYRSLFVRFFDKYVLDHAKVVHGITRQCASCLAYLTKVPVVVVNNQVNDMKLVFDQSVLKQQICFIGRFNIYSKGIDLSLKAFQLFQKQNNGNTSFVLVGPADPFAAAACQKLCKELDLQVGKTIIFTGKVPIEERNNILAESKVYLHLARREGFGLSIAQALSCYKPVIISIQVPIADKINAHNAGYVVSSPEEAAQALAKIFSLSSQDYLQMTINARHCYEQEFHPKVIKPQVMDLFNQVFAI